MSPRHYAVWFVSARERCEYCLVPGAVGFYPHEIDHVVAEKHLGQNQHPRCQCRGICADLRASAG